MDEALDPSAVELRLLSLGCNPSLATGRKKIIDAYLRLCRSTEELVMLKVEAANIMKYYEDRRSRILAAIADHQSVESHPFNRGAATMLHQMLCSNKTLLIQANTLNNLLNKDDETISLLDDDSCSDLSENED